jgi:tetratricopeptide (TPR) repeat protein
MKRNLVMPAIAVVLLLAALPFALAAQPAPASSAPSADGLLGQATEAMQKGDLTNALQLLNRAVELAPESVPVRMKRMMFLSVIQGRAGDESQNRALADLLRDDLQTIARLAPDEREGGIARDSLAQLAGRKLFPPPVVSCPDNAARELGQAETLLGSERVRESIAHYRKAAELCPDDPVYWIHYGDAHFVLGELDEARRLYGKGLEKAPWYGPGHRFLADALAKSGDWEGGYHEAVLAVLSDPTYEAGWLTLRDFITGRNGTWNRAYGEKPSVKRDAKGGITLGLNPGKEGDPKPDSMLWMSYGLAKSATYLPPQPEKGKGGEKKPAAPALSPLEREKKTVASVLQIRGEAGESPSRFWDMMARANQAGFLEEAIYLHLLDADLLPGYLNFRDKSRERLVRYVETVLAPLPPRR